MHLCSETWALLETREAWIFGTTGNEGLVCRDFLCFFTGLLGCLVAGDTILSGDETRAEFYSSRRERAWGEGWTQRLLALGVVDASCLVLGIFLSCPSLLAAGLGWLFGVGETDILRSQFVILPAGSILDFLLRLLFWPCCFGVSLSLLEVGELSVDGLLAFPVKCSSLSLFQTELHTPLPPNLSIAFSSKVCL